MQHYLLVVSRGLSVVVYDNGPWFHCVAASKNRSTIVLCYSSRCCSIMVVACPDPQRDLEIRSSRTIWEIV